MAQGREIKVRGFSFTDDNAQEERARAVTTGWLAERIAAYRQMGDMYKNDQFTGRAKELETELVNMRDPLTANPTITGRGLLQQTGSQQAELRQGQLAMNAPQLLFTYTVQEGRN